HAAWSSANWSRSPAASPFGARASPPTTATGSWTSMACRSATRRRWKRPSTKSPAWSVSACSRNAAPTSSSSAASRRRSCRSGGGRDLECRLLLRDGIRKRFTGGVHRWRIPLPPDAMRVEAQLAVRDFAADLHRDQLVGPTAPELDTRIHLYAQQLRVRKLGRRQRPSRRIAQR